MKSKDGEPNGDEQPRGIKSIEVGYRILTAIQEGPAPVALKAIAERVGISSGSAHLYLTSFVRTGLVQTRGRGRYTLGPALAALGMTAVRQVDSFEAIRAQANTLCDETGVGVAVLIWSETGPIILYNVPGKRKAPLELRNGPVSILWTGGGNVFIGLLPRTVTRPVARAEAVDEGMNARQCDALLNDIAATVARQGYAVQQVKQLPGFVAVSAPVWDSNGHVAYALTLTAPEGELDTSADGPHVAALLRAAQAVSQGVPQASGS